MYSSFMFWIALISIATQAPIAFGQDEKSDSRVEFYKVEYKKSMACIYAPLIAPEKGPNSFLYITGDKLCPERLPNDVPTDRGNKMGWRLVEAAPHSMLLKNDVLAMDNHCAKKQMLEWDRLAQIFRSNRRFDINILVDKIKIFVTSEPATDSYRGADFHIRNYESTEISQMSSILSINIWEGKDGCKWISADEIYKSILKGLDYNGGNFIRYRRSLPFKERTVINAEYSTPEQAETVWGYPTSAY